ncbi:MAG: transglutaminase-like domain-containing protein, partial [Anaerolineales bacterium]
DLQKGYCDYYASAMVVLSRAAGIPARLATGYLASTYDPVAGQYIVTGDQAHSWAELYFPDYGWVTFEPTAGQPALIRPGQRQVIPEQDTGELDFSYPSEEAERARIKLVPQNLFILAGGMVLLLILAVVAAHWIDLWTLGWIDPARMLSRVYCRLQVLAKKIGLEVNQTDTPLELAAKLEKELQHQNDTGFLRRWLDTTSQHAAFIIAACIQAAYTDRNPDRAEIRAVIHLWGRLRLQLILLWVRSIYQSIIHLVKKKLAK